MTDAKNDANPAPGDTTPAPELWRVATRITATFRDTDMYGHVNHTCYLTWIETARIRTWQQMLGKPAVAEHTFVLGELTIRYVAPAFFDDEVDVHVAPGRIGSRSFDLHYRLVRASDGALLATCVTTLVMFDQATNETRPVPDVWRDAVAARSRSVS